MSRRKLILVEQMGKKLTIVLADAFSKLIERAFNASKTTDACKLATLFQNILAASRINVIGALKVYLRKVRCKMLVKMRISAF